MSQFLNRKLRWVTLGGQYDWTQKRYPPENPPFPADLASFIHGLFPEITAEAAIVNVYTPGDTLSIHRDVSEDSDRGLVSVSLGCDGIFVIGLESGKEAQTEVLAVRLRSGDAMFLTGQAPNGFGPGLLNRIVVKKMSARLIMNTGGVGYQTNGSI